MKSLRVGGNKCGPKLVLHVELHCANLLPNRDRQHVPQARLPAYSGQQPGSIQSSLLNCWHWSRKTLKTPVSVTVVQDVQSRAAGVFSP
eukprot:7266835-Pyramimonas_sp.AAC.1